ncbi:MAG: glutamyl-tRNA amidotransferase [Bdellovibrio sp. CG10_big_fil_rev_8_21_14_0_10_47_8]|nr:MAG: glutamyl-tRNA amidotransferase [Bdellovibrio sp. CG10_big_fil_rev_8_21_14_0_10_47_8]
MELREKIMNDMKTAMREKNQIKLDTIRFLQSAIKNREIELRPEAITADDVLGVLKKLVKQRKESIEQYQAAQRQDLADKEMAELKVIEGYLPAQMGKDQVETLVTQVIAEMKAASIKDMGPVMKAVMAKTGGAADNKMVSEIIKSKLT